MIIFRPPELRCRFDLRYYRPIEAAALIDFIFGSFGRRLLRGRMMKNHRAILRSNIGTLPVQSSGIVVRPKDIQKFVVTDLRRIEFHFYHLCVSGPVGANIFIRRILPCPTCVTDSCGQNALQIPESLFHSPETTCAECGFLRLHVKRCCGYSRRATTRLSPFVA